MLGEGPLWSARDGALFWLDQVEPRLFRTAPPFERTEWRPLPRPPTCIALHADGRLLVGYREGIGLFDFATGTAEPLTLDDIDFATVTFNDAIADAAGRLWIGTRDRQVTEPIAALWRIGPALATRRMVDGVVLSNGLAFSPDGRTLYHADSRPGRITAFDFDPAAGMVSAARTLVDYAGRGRRPDGCTVDAEGYLWVAEIDGWRIARYAPDGTLKREIAVPVQKPSSVGFGGPDLSTLFVTSIRFGLTEEETAQQPLAGKLLRLQPGVHGVPEHVCTVGL